MNVYERFNVKGAKTLLFAITLIIILTIATIIYAWKNKSGMATAMATMVLVVITGYYAWNTREQSAEMRRQANIMENQFTLETRNIKRNIIT